MCERQHMSNKQAIENAFREGFEAGEMYAAATEVGLRHGVGLDVDTAWQEYVDSCSDL